jgi:V8-like Glu-specific endopeptidase
MIKPIKNKNLKNPSKLWFISVIVLLSVLPKKSMALMCSTEDVENRRPVEDTRVARITYKNATVASKLGFSDAKKLAATGFLISKRCLLTAAHVPKGANSHMYLNFSAPQSNIKGEIKLSSAKNIYDFSLVAIEYDRKDRKYGFKDWAVILASKNQISKRYPGEVSGYFEISDVLPQRGDLLQVKGYGLEMYRHYRKQYQAHLSSTLQETNGQYLHNVNDIEIYYDIDTRAGDSGAPVILNDKVVAIHHTGRCDNGKNKASGYNIVNNPKIQKAIQKCLELEQATRN